MGYFVRSTNTMLFRVSYAKQNLNSLTKLATWQNIHNAPQNYWMEMSERHEVVEDELTWEAP